MDLPNVLSKFGSKNKPQEKFLAVEIGSETVTTAVWNVVQGKTQLVSLGTTEDWEDNEKTDGLLSAIDNSLAKSLENITPEPDKVMFGLQEFWVDGETIEKKYSKLLKEVCDKFEFKPIGFVVTTDAIIKLLKKQEGTPPTVILIRVNETEIQVSVVNLGKVIGTQIVARSEDIGADVEEGLARFEVAENLPSKILLYNNNTNLEKLKQDLLSYDWLEKLPFLHFPKVEILDKQTPIKSVSLAGGAEAAQSLGLEVIAEEESVEEEINKEPEENFTAEKAVVTPQPIESETEADSGMIEADDNLLISPAMDIGFNPEFSVTGEDVKSVAKYQEDKKSHYPVLNHHPDTITETITKPVIKNKVFYVITCLVDFFKRAVRIFRYLKPPEIIKNGNSKFKLAAISSLIFFILLMISGVIAYWMLPKATLILFVRPKSLDKELTVIVDPAQTEINLSDRIIPGKFVEVEIEGTKEEVTTGTKIVGEKAVGEVTLYNKTSAQKTFFSGSIIVASNGLKFSIDSSVTIASASAQETDEGVTTIFGKGKTAVTALSIGADYNLAADTDFTISSLSSASYDAKNESAFSGGSSREVQAVSAKDLDSLRDSLVSELKQQAVDKLSQEEGFGMHVLTEGAQTEINSETANHQEGEEAQSVSLSLKLKIKTIAYYQNNFDQLLRQSVNESIPQDFEIREAESKTEISSVNYSDAIVTMDVIYKAILIPIINQEEIKNNIKGRYPELAKDYLKSLPNYSEVKIDITPKNIPARLKTFPRNPKNITIEVKVEPS